MTDGQVKESICFESGSSTLSVSILAPNKTKEKEKKIDSSPSFFPRLL